MAEFIKGTVEQHTASGKRTTLLFLNVDQVAKAEWDADADTLRLWLMLRKKGEHEFIELKGGEAQAALNLLQKR